MSLAVERLKQQSTIASNLRDAAATHEQRNRKYNNSYTEFGKVMASLFPQGIELNTVDEWNRFGAFFPIVAKIQRYAGNFKSGGHKDSAHDIIVYAAMLEELTTELQLQENENARS